MKVVETESGRRVGDKWKEATRGDATSVRTREEWSAESRTASELSSNRDIDHKRVGTQSTSMLQQSHAETTLRDTSRKQARETKGAMAREDASNLYQVLIHIFPSFSSAGFLEEVPYVHVFCLFPETCRRLNCLLTIPFYLPSSLSCDRRYFLHRVEPMELLLVNR